MIRPLSASYECGCRLAAAGIPLDYLTSLPREVDARRNHLYIGQLGGDFESRVLDVQEGDVRYLIALRLTTNLSRGIVISDWHLTTPWDHWITWDCDPADIVPDSDHPVYARLFDSHLSAVLNNKLHLSRRKVVEGLLCGRAYFESIPKSIRNRAKVQATLSLTDDSGQVFTRDIEMIVDRRAARHIVYEKRQGRLLEKRDSAAESVMRKQERRRAMPGSRPIRVPSWSDVVRAYGSLLGLRIRSKGSSAKGRGISARGRRHSK